MNKYEKGSFRDPSGYIFYKEGQVYRQINEAYKDNYIILMSSGLYEELVGQRLLIPHEEVDNSLSPDLKAYKVIKPDTIDFISYPYEWCFSQLKDAALTTLKVQKVALELGMCLKDASAYNIQFNQGSPVLIDTLSFEKYEEGKPWVAYGQFCRHFFAPLVLMAHKDIRLNQFLKIYIDGIPLDLTSSLLSFKTRFNFSILANIHLHSRTQTEYADKSVDTKKYKLSKLQMMALIDSLESSISRLDLKQVNTEWADYYNMTNYSDESFEHKKELVESYLQQVNSEYVWDLGANTGVFSRVASTKGINTISFDIDPIAVEKNYLEAKLKKENNILPLLLDLTNPSPGIGWENNERMAIKERRLPDTVLALALIHHIAISNNVPLSKVAEFFASICKILIIEFVPKTDSQVQKLLVSREDIFGNYNEKSFNNEFEKYFITVNSKKIKNTERILYLMKKK